MEVHIRHLGVFSGTGDTATATVEFKKKKKFLAWCSVTMVCSEDDFDDDNAFLMDVYSIDDKPTGVTAHGDKWGAPGSPANLRAGGIVAEGKKITFRLKSTHNKDLTCFGFGVVLVL